MNPKIEKYGVKSIDRPKIKTRKTLNLDGPEGEQIISTETKMVLRIHKDTFRKLADM